MILQGDCLIRLKDIPNNSVDACVTDPPYELGFMGKTWDNSGIANNPDMWREVLRVLKPGGHLLSFSGTRTYHRQAVAIEDAGFEIRDMVEWVYGSGFPKSLNIGKAVDKIQGNVREDAGSYEIGGMTPDRVNFGANDRSGGQGMGFRPGEIKITKGTSPWEGWGTALKPAHEPICLARKPISEKTVAQNVLKYGTGGLNIDKSRVGTEQTTTIGRSKGGTFEIGLNDPDFRQVNTGRFPANLLHDGSDEVVREFPQTGSGKYNKQSRQRKGFMISGSVDNIQEANAPDQYGDSGSASRFFKSFIYQAKASKSERNRGTDELEHGNNHATVKPLALMKYLIQMITPPGGTVLDPFAGSGSTLVAAKELGYDFIGIEMTEEYIPIIEARLAGTETEKQLSLLSGVKD